MAVTVEELANACNDLVKKGLGDKKVLISNDNEGAGFHTLYYLFTENAKHYSGLLDGNADVDDIVLLG